FFVVSTTASLLQKWFAESGHPSAEDPYFLYGASNLGSLLALVSYPALVEPYLTLTEQRFAWVGGFALLAALIGACALFLWQTPGTAPGDRKPASEPLPPVVPPVPPASEGIQARPAPRRGPAADVPEVEAVEQPVTWLRRLKWVTLAAV